MRGVAFREWFFSQSACPAQHAHKLCQATLMRCCDRANRHARFAGAHLPLLHSRHAPLMRTNLFQIAHLFSPGEDITQRELFSTRIACTWVNQTGMCS